MTHPPRPLAHPRDELVDTLQRIYGYRMTTTSGGNLSVRDETGHVWITPARVDKGSLTRADIVRVNPDGVVTEGRHKPSSEYPFHQAIYRARPDVNAIVHAHPVALVAFSIARKTPDTALFPQAAHVCGTTVGYAPYALPGSAALGRNIADVFAQGFNCVMLENHGVVIAGQNLAQAFARFETLEFTAKTIIKAAQLGPVRYLTPDQLALAERPRPGSPLPEFDPAQATIAEKETRRDLADFIRRGYRQRLLTSTGGSFSARLADDTFLISSYNVDRGTISPDQLTLVDHGRRHRGHTPSRAVALHRHLYRTYPTIRAIVNATPVNATAFSVSPTAKLDVRTIPESYVFLAEVPTLPYPAAFGDGADLAPHLSPSHPVALLESNGALVLGTTILDAFDRLEVLESTAEALINSRPLGPLQPMTPAQIAELRAAFNMT